MSPIPLPALDVKNPSAENPMDAVMRIFQARALANQNQLQGAQLQGEQMRNQAQSLELQDDQKWRDAMADPSWDGTPDGLLKNGLKRGVGPKSYFSMQQGLAQSQEAMAKLGSSQLSILNSVQDKIGDLMENVRDAKPEGKLAAQVAAKRDAESAINGTVGLNPHARQALLQHVDSIPDDQYVGDDVVSQMVGTMKLHSALTEEALKHAQTNEATQKGNQAAAAAANDRANLPKIQAEASVAPQMAQLGVTAKRTEIAKNVAETNKAKVETENLGQLPVFAVDPKTNTRLQTTRPEATANGYTNVVPVKEGDVAKERDATAMTNDVQLNLSRYRTTMKKMYQEPANFGQTAAMDALMPEKLGIDIGHGIGINLPDVIQKVVNASAFSKLTSTQKQAVVGYYSTLASVPVAQKALSNIGRSNKEMLDLELRTIPTPLMDEETHDIMLDRFQGNIDQTAAKNVRIAGMPTTAEIRAQNEPGWQPTQKRSPWPPNSMQPMSSLLDLVNSR